MASLKTHFQTMSVTDKSQEPPHEIEVTGLIAPGEVLVSIPQGDSEPHSEIILEAGEYTELNPDRSAVVSSCYGYPQATFSTSDGKQCVHVSLTPLVWKAADLMEARLQLYPPLPHSSMPTLADILLMLEESGVVHGVDSVAIQHAIQSVKETGLPVKNSLIARGKPPRHGSDAYLRFEVEIGPLPGKLLSNGSIDFRERLMFVGVSNEQILATKVAATAGRPGINIAGESIAAHDGKDLTVKVSDDTIYNEHDNTVRATASGVLSMINNDTIRVSSMQKIDGDIDFSTGNIRSQNAVEITGSIQPDFMVSTKGDLLIHGNIQSSTVNSHGNLIVKGGLLGPGTEVRIQGDAEVNYIEQSLLVAGGNIVIRSSGYYSDIQAAGNIHCPEKVKLVGGNIVAGGSLSAGQVGSMAGKPVQISVGIDPRRYRKYQDLQKGYKETLETIRKWYNRHGKKQKNGSITGFEEKLADLEHDLNSLNLIPGTPKDSLGKQDYFFSSATISVFGTIAAASIIRVGNETMVLGIDYNHCKIGMDKNSGAITFLPL